MNLILTKISQKFFQMISQFMKSCFEVIDFKSFDQKLYSNVRKQFMDCLYQIFFLKWRRSFCGGLRYLFHTHQTI